MKTLNATDALRVSSRDTLLMFSRSEAFISGDILEQSGPLAAVLSPLLTHPFSARAEQPVFEHSKASAASATLAPLHDRNQPGGRALLRFR